jgi:NAD-dependent deacetylase
LPNAGHHAIAELEQCYEVVVVTQNVDNLHERAGSTNVIHVHGELTKARSTADDSLIYEIGDRPIHLGDHCPLGSQLRPHIVWFGENVMRLDEAQGHFLNAGWVLVVGTSLTVFPVAGLVDHAPDAAEKVLVDLDATAGPHGFRVMRGSADVILPELVRDWCQRS